MIMDRQIAPSTAQAVTVTAFSTDVIDLAVANRDLGRSEPLRAISTVDTAFTAAGAGTLLVELVESANADLSSPTVLFAANGGTPFALAALVPGGNRLMDIKIPTTTKRYLGFRYTVATGPMTAGAVSSSIVMDTPSPIATRPYGVTGY